MNSPVQSVLIVGLQTIKSCIQYSLNRRMQLFLIVRQHLSENSEWILQKILLNKNGNNFSIKVFYFRNS